MVGLLCSMLVTASDGFCCVNNVCARNTCFITSQVCLLVLLSLVQWIFLSRYYLQKMEDYPKDRKAFIPFIC